MPSRSQLLFQLHTAELFEIIARSGLSREDTQVY